MLLEYLWNEELLPDNNTLPEDRSWIWYGYTITQAVALVTQFFPRYNAFPRFHPMSRTVCNESSHKRFLHLIGRVIQHILQVFSGKLLRFPPFSLGLFVSFLLAHAKIQQPGVLTAVSIVLAQCFAGSILM